MAGPLVPSVALARSVHSTGYVTTHAFSVSGNALSSRVASPRILSIGTSRAAVCSARLTSRRVPAAPHATPPVPSARLVASTARCGNPGSHQPSSRRPARRGRGRPVRAGDAAVSPRSCSRATQTSVERAAARVCETKPDDALIRSRHRRIVRWDRLIRLADLDQAVRGERTKDRLETEPRRGTTAMIELASSCPLAGDPVEDTEGRRCGAAGREVRDGLKYVLSCLRHGESLSDRNFRRTRRCHRARPSCRQREPGTWTEPARRHGVNLRGRSPTGRPRHPVALVIRSPSSSGRPRHLVAEPLTDNGASPRSARRV